MEVDAENKEYNVEKINDNITMLPGAYKVIDFRLEKAKEFEIIYSTQVKEGQPIDLWLVNEDNYMLLINDVNFLYYIDGSEREVSYTKKIVSLSEEGLYKLVLANLYTNQTLTVGIIYEIRSYITESGETDNGNLSTFYLLITGIVILIVIVSVLFVKMRINKKEREKALYKASTKKKTKKHKYKKPKPKVIKESKSREIPEEKEIKSTKSILTEKISSKFCGICGNSVTTPYCTNCGSKI